VHVNKELHLHVHHPRLDHVDGVGPGGGHDAAREAGGANPSPPPVL
jgi:hypothetical protein